MAIFEQLTIGAQAEQVDEHFGMSAALFIFEYECYPEAKILSSAELWELHQRLGGWPAVGQLIGASDAFALQTAKHNRILSALSQDSVSS